MFKWKWNQNWENRIYFVLQVIFGKMFQTLRRTSFNCKTCAMNQKFFDGFKITD